MNGQHLNSQPRRGCHGFGDRVWDVVKFEIEENLPAGGSDLPYDLGTRAREKFAADLECANRRTQVRREPQCSGGIRHIKSGDDGISHAGSDSRGSWREK